MPGTVQAVAAQRAAMTIVSAFRQRDEFGDEPLLAMVRDACREHHPTNVLVALAALVPAMAQLAERGVVRLLADPEALRALADAHDAGFPPEPATVGLSAEDLLACAGVATSLLEPG